MSLSTLGYFEVQDSMFDSKFESTTGNVLSIVDNFEVTLCPKDNGSNANQMWQCSMPYQGGWFRIRQAGTGFSLANKGLGQLKVEGS